MKIYKTVENQSIIDICLNIYGDLNNLEKLLKDNNLNFQSYIPARTDILYSDGTTPLPIKIATLNDIINNNIYITSQPVSDSICVGTSNPILSVTTNDDSTYRWLRSTSENGVYANIYDSYAYSGTNTKNLTIYSEAFRDNIAGVNIYWYKCLINGYLYSDPASVTIYTAPLWINISGPTNSLTLHNNYTYSAVVNIPCSNYQWLLSTDNGSSFNNIGSTTSVGSTTFVGYNTRTLSLLDTSYSLNATGLLKCVASNGLCGGSVATASATFSVTPVSFAPPVLEGLAMLQMGADADYASPAPYLNHDNPWPDRMNSISIGTTSRPTGYPGMENTGFVASGMNGRVDYGTAEGITGYRSLYYGQGTIGTYSTTPFIPHDERYPGITISMYATISTAMTVMGVAKTRNAATSPQGILTSLDVSLYPDESVKLYIEPTGDIFWWIKGDVGASIVTNNTTGTGSTFIFTAIAEKNTGTDDTIDLWINGDNTYSVVNSLSANTNGFTVSTYTPYIGNIIPSGTSKYDGYIGAMLYYNRVLTDDERQQMETWLNDNFGGNII